MRANITVVTYNRFDLTYRCLESLLTKTRSEFFCNVVDNASSDGTREYLQTLAVSHPNVKVHFLNRNMGVAVASNYGWAETEAEYYLKLDNDIEILDGDWLERLLTFMDTNPEVAVGGYKFMNWPHRQDKIRLPSGDPFIASDCCNGGCAAIPKRIHEQLGFWTEDYGKYGFEDVDYSDRAIMAGFLVGYPDDFPQSTLHLGFEPGMVDDGYEKAKDKNVASQQQGQRLYVLNKFLFSRKIRPLYVERRYLPKKQDGEIRFGSNPAYAPIIRLHQEYLPRLDYTGESDHIAVSFSDSPLDEKL